MADRAARASPPEGERKSSKDSETNHQIITLMQPLQGGELTLPKIGEIKFVYYTAASPIAA